jgi:hypothetical protein
MDTWSGGWWWSGRSIRCWRRQSRYVSSAGGCGSGRDGLVDGNGVLLARDPARHYDWGGWFGGGLTSRGFHAGLRRGGLGAGALGLDSCFGRLLDGIEGLLILDPGRLRGLPRELGYSGLHRIARALLEPLAFIA